MKSTVTANANIALIKYWGKKDFDLNIPQNNSLSVTLDGLTTKTTVEFSSLYKHDELILNNILQSIEESKKLISFLNLIREKANINLFAKVISENNFPTAAGLASSSSGFAALALAGCDAAGLNLSKKELSILARKGSGSAARSIFGGFVEWAAGKIGYDESSYAMQLYDENYWPEIRVIVLVLEEGKKEVSSRSGMQSSVFTSPMYKSWLDTVNLDLISLKRALLEKDFTRIGSIAESNCLKMHSTMLTSNPPLIYWNANTLELVKYILELRKNGLEIYFTIDAGPQIKILCLEKDVLNLKKKLNSFDFINKIIDCSSGSGAFILNE